MCFGEELLHTDNPATKLIIVKVKKLEFSQNTFQIPQQWYILWTVTGQFHGKCTFCHNHKANNASYLYDVNEYVKFEDLLYTHVSLIQRPSSGFLPFFYPPPDLLSLGRTTDTGSRHPQGVCVHPGKPWRSYSQSYPDPPALKVPPDGRATTLCISKALPRTQALHLTGHEDTKSVWHFTQEDFAHWESFL